MFFNAKHKSPSKNIKALLGITYESSSDGEAQIQPTLHETHIEENKVVEELVPFGE
jgi:hypothetical protein